MEKLRNGRGSSAVKKIYQDFEAGGEAGQSDEFDFDRALLNFKESDDFDFIEDGESDAWETRVQKVIILAMVALLASLLFYAQYSTNSQSNFNDRIIQYLDDRYVG